MVNRTIALDHIIILLPYATVQNPPRWLTENFTITPGGRHADGKTENKLVVFQDGSYLELIAFINDDPKLREGHWWDKPFGIVDFAFTTSDGAEANFAEVQNRLEAVIGCDVRYLPPREGTRKRDDGKTIGWNVTWPDVTGEYRRGEVPFFCHDITERNLRAPMDKEYTTHPGFGYGIKGLAVYVPESKVKALAEAYAAILAQEHDIGAFELDRLYPVEGAKQGFQLTIKMPQEEWQVKAVNERGVLIGDMVVGGISVLAMPGMASRIDTADGGIGRVFRDLDLPPGWSAPEVPYE